LNKHALFEGNGNLVFRITHTLVRVSVALRAAETRQLRKVQDEKLINCNLFFEVSRGAWHFKKKIRLYCVFDP